MAQIIEKPLTFKFLKEKPGIESWETLKPYFDEIKNRDVLDVDSLKSALADLNELIVYIGDSVRWLYINMSRDTENQLYTEQYKNYLTNIQPNLTIAEFELEKKFLNSPAINELEPDLFGIYIRNAKNKQQIFKEENIPLRKELGLLEKEYGKISGKMTIEIDGEEKPVTAAEQKLKASDREVRKTYYERVNNRRIQDSQALNELYDELVKLRTQIAENAGYDNFRDFIFRDLNRFDYTPEDCFVFHDAIEAKVVPLLKQEYLNKKEKLGLDTLRPYDIDADPDGKAPSTPFKDTDDLIEKTILCLDKVNPFFAKCLDTMRERGHLDLDARKGKSPGGYNMSLPLTGGAFIFMNASGSERDVKTMVHEAGHAVQSFLIDKQPFNFQKSLTSEVAELAAMSMELFTMDNWEVFYTDEESLKTAKKNQIKNILTILPWVATIDGFQHWVYTNKNHTHEQRYTSWLEIFERFSPDVVNWEGYEDFKKNIWLKQLHLFHAPFYYIEYAMAQLGAVAMWKQYKINPQQAIENYINALSLGNTKTIPDIYREAGIEFNFTKPYLEELVLFLLEEFEKVK